MILHHVRDHSVTFHFIDHLRFRSEAKLCVIGLENRIAKRVVSSDTQSGNVLDLTDFLVKQNCTFPHFFRRSIREGDHQDLFRLHTFVHKRD